ncbi:MAG: hypothetical protein NVSMB44_36860 [Ktedonobacteraceae bacterium]
MPEQQEFHQHLRALAQSTVRTVLELVMREELDAFIGAAWGEVAQTLLGVAPSASTISRLNQSLSHQFDTWRQRKLPGH